MEKYYSVDELQDFAISMAKPEVNAFNHVLRQVDIVTIIKGYIPLEEVGDEYVTECPFGKNHSLKIPKKRKVEVFYCSKCVTGGDAITFVAKIEGCGQKAALFKIAKKYDIKIPLDLISNNGITIA